MSDQHDFDPNALLTPQFWDERYSTTAQVWSGNPNPHLITQTADLTPGTALDVGCGEGADVIWLAAQGWQVTGIDVSQVALDRAASKAAEAGPDVAARITWQQADIRTWEPAPGQYDLVAAHFIHLPSQDREAFHRRLAAGVRPGGRLLIVGHHPSDLETTAGRWRLPDFMFTEQQIVAALDPAAWDIEVAAAPARPATDPDGQPITIHDAVVRARRR